MLKKFGAKATKSFGIEVISITVSVKLFRDHVYIYTVSV